MQRQPGLLRRANRRGAADGLPGSRAHARCAARWWWPATRAASCRSRAGRRRSGVSRPRRTSSRYRRLPERAPRAAPYRDACRRGGPRWRRRGAGRLPERRRGGLDRWGEGGGAEQRVGTDRAAGRLVVEPTLMLKGHPGVFAGGEEQTINSLRTFVYSIRRSIFRARLCVVAGGGVGSRSSATRSSRSTSRASASALSALTLPGFFPVSISEM